MFAKLRDLRKILNYLRPVQEGDRLHETIRDIQGQITQIAGKFEAIIAENKQKQQSIEQKLNDIENKFEEILQRVQHLDDREVETIKKMLFELSAEKKNLNPNYEIKTEFPIAYDSPDHVMPWGTRNDNSIWYGFNEKLYAFMGGRDPLHVMDLGCAGGGFVESLLEDGHDAIGIEGSDYSFNHKRAAWRIIPGRLFTCDLSKPFAIQAERIGPVQFDVITAWELMEHFCEGDIEQVLQNIVRHLADEGYFMCSIATSEDSDPVSGTKWHQTVKPADWWIGRFKKIGLVPVVQDIIGKDDWIRGSKHQVMDWHENEGVGFHLVLKKSPRADKCK
jgi:2-polyprenyl-3-methyl-5-hydroxy-6-metoxy-1,4-benzoquinol methylase